MQQLEEGTTPVRWPRNESIQSGSHSCQLLDLFGIPKWLYVINGSNLIKVNFDFVVGNHIPQKFARAYAKRTLSGIKGQFMFPQYLENIPEIIYMLGLYFTLYHHIIYVDLNIFA